MVSAPFPDPGQDDGEQPPRPGDSARDGTPCGEDDWDADADLARFLEDLEAGRAQVPDEDTRGPAVTFSLGEAADVDPVALAKMAGPDGLGGECFDQDKAADALRPGPILFALAEQAVGELPGLSGDGLLGVVSAARRLAARAEYLELAATAEFTRRRAAEYAADKARKVPRGGRAGEFADAELAQELVTSIRAAGEQMDFATDLTTRLPRTFAALGAGRLDAIRASIIWSRTQFLTDEDAATADQILGAAAPGMRYDQLARKAARVEMKLDPEAVKRRKEDARREGQRVEARRELSGNMSYGGRELATADALAAKAAIDAAAVALRNAGVDGSLNDLRVIAYLARLTGRDPLDRTRPEAGGQPATGSAADGTPGGRPADANPPDQAGRDPGTDDEGGPGSGTQGPGNPGGRPADANPPDQAGHDPGTDDDEGGPRTGPQGPGTAAGGLAPLPALINLIIPAGTLLGWSAAPGEAGNWGLLDGDDTRQIVQAASRHPRTRWCVTLTGPDGTAIAHGCARGQHPWIPPPASTHPPPDWRHPEPDAQQAAQLAQLMRRLNITFTPIAKGTCDHRQREDRYTPSRKLKHLVRARTLRCTARGCDAQAYFCDLDHTTAYPDGMTCECGLGPKCRRHHRTKQAPGWRVEQPQPGVFRWTTPSGRSYTTTPTVYDL
jgi:Domain of unknown function (DUF222)